MIEFKEIMVPTDFSEPSECAVRYGRALAERFGATLHLVHVLEEVVALGWAPDTYVAAMPRLREELEVEAFERLGRLAAESAGVPQVKKALLTGNAFVEIVRYARERNVDLIVMGTHGRGPIAHMLLGSVAEKVVRKAHCAVLTVRHPEHEFVMP